MSPEEIAQLRIDAVISFAEAEIGETEVSGQPNNIKYNTDYYGHTVTDGTPSGCTYPWCVVFLWWIFKKASLSTVFFTDNNGKVASVATLTTYAKDKGQWVTSGYKRGDIVSFISSSHVGIVTGVAGNTIYTIEGNSSDSVAAKSYSITSAIKGAYRPKYA